MSKTLFPYFDFVRYDFSHLYCDVMEAIACAPLSPCYGFKVPFFKHTSNISLNVYSRLANWLTDRPTDVAKIYC